MVYANNLGSMLVCHLKGGESIVTHVADVDSKISLGRLAGGPNDPQDGLRMHKPRLRQRWMFGDQTKARKNQNAKRSYVPHLDFLASLST
jgi:hypothetical protein